MLVSQFVYRVPGLEWNIILESQILNFSVIPARHPPESDSEATSRKQGYVPVRCV